MSLRSAVTSGTRYYYVVRAEDSSSNGTGPCNGGVTDVNLNERSGVDNDSSHRYFSGDRRNESSSGSQPIALCNCSHAYRQLAY